MGLLNSLQEAFIKRFGLWILFVFAIFLFLVLVIFLYSALFPVNISIELLLSLGIFILTNSLFTFFVYFSDGKNFGSSRVFFYDSYRTIILYIVSLVLGIFNFSILEILFNGSKSIENLTIDLVYRFHFEKLNYPLILSSSFALIQLAKSNAGEFELSLNFKEHNRLIQNSLKKNFINIISDSFLWSAKLSIFFAISKFAVKFYFLWLCNFNQTCQGPGFVEYYFQNIQPLSCFINSLFLVLITNTIGTLLLISLAYLTKFPISFHKLEENYPQMAVRSSLPNQCVSKAEVEASDESSLICGILIGSNIAIVDPSTHGSNKFIMKTISQDIKDNIKLLINSENIIFPQWKLVLNAQLYIHDVLSETLVHRDLDFSVMPYFNTQLVQMNNDNLLVSGTLQQHRSPIGKFYIRQVPLNSLDYLIRSLAFQDLYKLSGSPYPARRQTIYKKHWIDLYVAVCAMLSASAIQIQQITVYFKSALKVSDISSRLDLNIDGTFGNPDSQTLQKENESSKFDFLAKIRRFRNQLAQNSTTEMNTSSSEEVFNGSEIYSKSSPSVISKFLSKASNYILNLGKLSFFCQVKEVKNIGKAKMYEQSNPSLSFYLNTVPKYMVRRLLSIPNKGDVTLALDAFSEFKVFPPCMTQSIGHCIDSIASLIISALTEDPTGMTIHSVPGLIVSLFSLELAIIEFSNMVHDDYISKLKKVEKVPSKKYHLRKLHHLPKELEQIAEKLAKAIRLIILNFGDYIKRCSFPAPFNEMLDEKLRST